MGMIWLSPIPIPYVSWLSTMEMIYTWQLPIPFPYHQSYCHLIFPIPISSRQTGDLIWEWYGYPWLLLHSNAIWWIFVCVSLVKSWNPSVWCWFSARILPVSWTKQLGSQIHIHFISLILGGLLASTHFMLIFCSTWLGVGPSLENLEQTVPKKERSLILFAFKRE